jgi:hypothetical protein
LLTRFPVTATVLSPPGSVKRQRSCICSLQTNRKQCFEVIEHRAYTVQCSCSQRHDSILPAAVSDLAQYGPNVGALGVHVACAAELIGEMTGLLVLPATLLAWTVLCMP